MELSRLKKRELKALQTTVCKELRRRYHDHRPPKYGNLNKTFRNQEELDIFFHAVTNTNARMIFQLQAYLGLRIGEACGILMEDLDLRQRRLWVRSTKDSVPAVMYLHDRIYTCLLEYLTGRNWKHQKYLFPSWALEHGTKSRWPYLSPDWARNQFCIAIAKTNLQFTYAETEGEKKNALHKLSTHSLRRWFIQHVHETTGDVMVTQKLARHRNVKNTLIYLHADQNKMDKVLEETFLQG